MAGTRELWDAYEVLRSWRCQNGGTTAETGRDCVDGVGLSLHAGSSGEEGRSGRGAGEAASGAGSIH
jgi:hypothetical protein